MRNVILGDYVNIQTGKLDANAASEAGLYPFFTCSREVLAIDHYAFDKECILVAGNGDLNVKYYNGKFNAYQRTYVIESRNKNELDTKYLYYFMNKYLDKLRHLSIGGVIKYIKLQNLTDIYMPLPGIDDQKRIVNTLDKAQTLIDKRKQAIAKLDELVQAVFLDMFGDPVTNSKNLDTISLGELGEWKSGGTPSRGSKEYFKGNIPWYTSGELNDLYVNDSIEYITETALKETSTKEVPIGALLLGMYDTAALKSSITQKRSSCNQAIAFAKIDENLAETKYVYYAIQMGKEHYKRVQRGVRQKNLNLSMIKAIEILYPSLELQKDFVRIADIIYLNKQQMNVQLQQLESNFQALLQKAFKGELIVRDGVTV